MSNNELKKDEQPKQNGMFVPFAIADTWAGAIKEFFKQLGAVTSLLMILVFVGQACNILDVYRILNK